MDAVKFFRTGALAAVGLAAVAFGVLKLQGEPSAAPAGQDGAQADALTAHAKAPIVLTPADRRPMAEKYMLIAGAGAAAGQPLGQVTGGAPALLHFWATWCGPCIAEMPEIDALAARLKPKFKVLAVSLDRDGVAAATQFFAQHHLNALSPIGATADSPNPEGLPTSMLIDRHGRVAWIAMGPHPWGADVDKAVDQLNAEQ